MTKAERDIAEKIYQVKDGINNYNSFFPPEKRQHGQDLGSPQELRKCGHGGGGQAQQEQSGDTAPTDSAHASNVFINLI